MGLEASLILYLLAGAGVAAAVDLSEGNGRKGRRSGERIFRVMAAVPFWPLFLPLLLAGRGVALDSESGGQASDAPMDELAQAIARADAELEAALGSLPRLREKAKIGELRAAWAAQAERIREMDRLLAREEEPRPECPASCGTAGERVLQLERARRINRDRLRQLRGQAHDELMTNLAWVRELASLITLARFNGEPAARAEELVSRIAEAVEGLGGRPT
jgi:hypothetical protein